jgi:ABC-type transporter MlaC component
MKAVEFAYWLQGYFEISGTEDTLTVPQARKILSTAKKVRAGREEAEKDAMDFVFSLTALLGCTTPELKIADTALTAVLKEATPQLKKQLNNLFQHAIDPSYDGDQSQFNNHHNGSNGGPVMRC